MNSLKIVRDNINRVVDLVIYNITKGRGEKRSFPMPKIAAYEDAIALFGEEDTIAILQDAAKERAKDVSFTLEAKRKENPSFHVDETVYLEAWDDSDASTGGRASDPNSKSGLRSQISVLDARQEALNAILPAIASGTFDINIEAHAEAAKDIGEPAWTTISNATTAIGQITAIATVLAQVVKDKSELEVRLAAMPTNPRGPRKPKLPEPAAEPVRG